MYTNGLDMKELVNQMEVGKNIDAKVIIYMSEMWHKPTTNAVANIQSSFHSLNMHICLYKAMQFKEFW